MESISTRFPKSLPVAGFRIPVKWESDVTVEIDDIDIPVYGYYQSSAPKPVIVLHSGQNYEIALNTFAHETLHAWFGITGILGQPELEEEVAVRALTPLLVQLMKEWKKNG
jgi:hypothetical protein